MVLPLSSRAGFSVGEGAWDPAGASAGSVFSAKLGDIEACPDGTTDAVADDAAKEGEPAVSPEVFAG